MSCAGPRFVVTGCGRSGTRFVAEVLQELGCTAGHEALFDPPMRRPPEFGGRHGDVSWAAVPMLEALAPTTVVLHQVRDPLAVIRSAVSFGLFRGPLGLSVRDDVARRAALGVDAIRRVLGGSVPHRHSTVRSYKRMVRAFRPRIWEGIDEPARAARYWVDWNLATERGAEAAGLAYRRYRLEELTGDLLDELLGLTGHHFGADRCQAALDRIPPDTNRRTDPGPLGWSDLPPTERADVLELAARYGCSTGTP